MLTRTVINKRSPQCVNISSLEQSEQPVTSKPCRCWAFVFVRTYAMTRFGFRQGALLAGIIVAGAVLYAAPILRPRLAFLTFVATVPWLAVILSPDLKSRKRSPVWFLILVYLIGLLSINWLGSFNVVGWLISPLFYLPLFLPTFYITRGLRAAWPALPLSVIWGLSLTGTEWLRIWAAPGEVPFCQLGASLVPFSKLIQVVDVSGASALSTIAAVSAGFLADVALYLPSTVRPRKLLTVGLSLCVLVTVFTLSIWYGHLNDRTDTFAAGPRVGVIQTNMPGWREEDASRFKLQRAIDLTVSSGPLLNADLIIWPENSVILSELDNASSADYPVGRVTALARSTGVPILFDGPFDVQSLSERHRSALVLPDGTLYTYEKQLLVPWSEYAPFEETLRSFNSAMADGYLTFLKSRNPDFTATRVEEKDPMPVFRYSARRGQPVIFGAPICYEILSPRLVNRWYAALGEDELQRFFLVNQVNEILLGSSVHAQTLAFCQLRAVEGRVSVIRAANNGISAAIDPNGRVYDILLDPESKSSIDVAGAFFPEVIWDARGGRTIYARYGDWWPVSCLLFSLGLILFGYARRRWIGSNASA